MTSSAEETVVQDYEVFKNEKNALAFFFYHNAVLDMNNAVGPFWFSIRGDNAIRAGTQAHHVVFEDVNADIINMARERGVIMMMEFVERDPVRCTPCYITDAF
ncbi:MAG: hypothetical protein KGL10_08645 [Alphaproteobacteria bacterium]|nr:hypothetical protein [Alphaproteobacteria bacterium]MDE2337368.1 hypothetical protein [Alphaproteobacteria bacterium]